MMKPDGVAVKSVLLTWASWVCLLVRSPRGGILFFIIRMISLTLDMLYLQTAHLTLCNGLFSYFLLASMPFKRSGCSKGVSHQPTSPPAPVPKKWASSVADFGIRFFNIQPGTSVNIALEFFYDLFGLFKIFLRCLDVGYQSPPIKHQIWVRRVPGPPMGPQFRPILVHPWDPKLAEIGIQP